uniref:Uncharacterized protein n=1 Tax=Melanopsichium pennsylvanicum 4 TaxID=1398559 RepID=A0A077R7J8_9BASI|nr:putative protein [Melanopsichium pennsylvanicum 4]
MLLRPQPGRLRALFRQAGKLRNRPRTISTITPFLRPNTIVSPIHPRLHSSPIISHISNGAYMRTVSRRAFTSASRPIVRRTGILAATLQRLFLRATKAVRGARLTRQFLQLSARQIFTTLRTLQLGPYQVRSSLLKGVISTFRSTATRATPVNTRNAYLQLNKPSIAFARGTLSGYGSRPSAGQLTLSPLKGGMGLQSARKFSSGGARVFDNLIVNAPLALRLASDELDDKAKLARRKSITTSRQISARRTGASFAGKNLAKKAFVFATTATKHHFQPTPSISLSPSSVVTKESLVVEEEEHLTYFQFPQISLPIFGSSTASCETLVTIRLIDPLHVALGSREPTPPTQVAVGPRLFDEAFLHDANTVLEYEHRRYLRAKAILRVLRDANLLHDMDLSSDPAVWTVLVKGRGEVEVKTLLDSEVGFEWRSWCNVECLSSETEDSSSESGGGGLDLSVAQPPSLIRDSRNAGASASMRTGEEDGFEYLNPSLSAMSGECAGMSSVESEDLISLPDDGMRN